MAPGEAIDRRDFVRCVPAAAGVWLGLSGCAGAAYLVPAFRGDDRLVVPASAIGPDGAFIEHPREDRPVFVSRGANGAWSAVLARCTHRGCRPEPVVGRLACPCHGSEFSLDGAVLEGPAREPLRRFRVAEEGDEIVIWMEEGV